jgi:long-chain acyl-CoA synthetase
MFSGILTIQSALKRACHWYANQPAFLVDNRTVTYAEFELISRQIASGYQDLGVSKGDRIAFLCESSIDHALAFYAAHWLGVVTVNLHFRETLDHHSALIERLDPAVLVFASEKKSLVASLQEKFRDLKTICLNDTTGSLYSLKSIMRNFDPLEELPTIAENDPAVIQLSSGSTGVPKALVHTHASVLETWNGGIYMWSGIDSGDRFLNSFSPSFSVWLVHAGSFLNHGAAVVFQAHWEPVDFLQMVEEKKITCTALTPTQWRTVLESDPEKYDLSSLRMVAYLGEKMAPQELKALIERICPSSCSFYGMTECLGIGGCVIRSSDCLELGKWGSVGRPSLNSDLRIAVSADVAGEGKRANETGEIVVRSASFASESLGDSAWRKCALTSDGWYRTGDLGYVDEDGYVFLVGRADNQISTGGIKVAAEEIELFIETHPDVLEAMVIGEPDEIWGEQIIAFVVPAQDTLTDAALEMWCREHERLASFKIPKKWHFLQSLPHNSAGKRDRKVLKLLRKNEISQE